MNLPPNMVGTGLLYVPDQWTVVYMDRGLPQVRYRRPGNSLHKHCQSHCEEGNGGRIPE